MSVQFVNVKDLQELQLVICFILPLVSARGFLRVVSMKPFKGDFYNMRSDF